MTTYYSDNEEIFNCESVEEAVEHAISNDPQIKVGDVLSIFSGESETIDVKSYVPNIIDSIRDQSYDDMGEFADDFPDASEKIEREIQSEVENLISKLFEKHNLNPTFYKIKNPKTIEVVITNLDEIKFEIKQLKGF